MLRSVTQFVRHRWLNSAKPNQPWSLGCKIWFKVEQTILKFADPILDHRIGSFPFRLPASHILPRILNSCPHYNQNLAAISREVASAYPGFPAIDIGANIGDSIAMMRQYAHFPILCIEADRRYFELLRENSRQFKDVTVAQAYLGEQDRHVAARLTTAQGTGKLSAATAGDGVEIRTLCSLLRDFPQFAGAKLLKIDTDGYDNKILRGAREFIAQAKPVILFEYDPHFLSLQNDDGLSIFPFLKDLGYDDMLVYDNLGPLREGISLKDDTRVRAMHEWAGSQPGARYVDLCVFHQEDQPIFNRLLQLEKTSSGVAA